MNRLLAEIIKVGLLTLGLTCLGYASQYGSSLCQSNSSYDCYQVQKYDTWRGTWPDARERDVIMRLNRTNIPMRYHRVLAVPRNLGSIDVLSISPFSIEISSYGEPVILISLTDKAFGAYNSDGELVHWGPISGGKGWCPDTRSYCRTVTGSFRMYRKDNHRCYSRKFPLGEGGAPMPWCMFFHGGFAIHASNEVPGHHASHGCVRVFYQDARWLNKYFVKVGARGTKVIIQSN